MTDGVTQRILQQACHQEFACQGGLRGNVLAQATSPCQLDLHQHPGIPVSQTSISFRAMLRA